MIGDNKCRMQNAECRIDTQTQRGFTLMEMLVALSLFSVVVVIATDLFSTFQKISRKTESLQQLTSDARFITETVARYVRENRIDYGAYSSPLSGAQNTLHLIPSAQTPTITVGVADDCWDGKKTFRCVQVTQGNSIPERFSGADIWVRSLQFYITPAENPFAFDLESGDYLSNAQPRVTVFLSLANSKDDTAQNYTKYEVQTTITNRIYTR
ncbi:MAG: type II secretion system protein [bacterium]|nr:type II secretion system protein [bacterium]